MFAVCVTIHVHPADVQEFLLIMQAQAENSLKQEDQCRQFDVALGGEDGREIFLYEVYDSAEAFNAHLGSDHFAEFDARVADMMSEKIVKTYTILDRPG